MLGVVAADIPIHILDHTVTVVSSKQLQTPLLNALNLHKGRDLSTRKILGCENWVIYDLERSLKMTYTSVIIIQCQEKTYYRVTGPNCEVH